MVRKCEERNNLKMNVKKVINVKWMNVIYIKKIDKIKNWLMINV